ncbi:MAG: bacteriohemerythrin [archaeon]|jgi:hemerythrin
MGRFVWSEKYSVGVKEIDEQHKYFIDLLDRADELLKQKNPNSGADDIVKELEAYARKHFDTEEKFLKSINYNKILEHSIEHLKLLEKTNLLYDGVLVGKVKLRDVVDFLEDWLDHHLLTFDKEYADFIKKKNSKKRFIIF